MINGRSYSVDVASETSLGDGGIVVSPDGVRSQIEGALFFGLSGALAQKNFEDYSILRMDEVPDVDVHVVESTEAPTGVGESGTATVAPRSPTPSSPPSGRGCATCRSCPSGLEQR